MKLEKETIINAAFILLNEQGLDKFSLRSLATRLSVSATALYWHFKDKDDLTRAMVRYIYDDAYSKSSDQYDWQTSLIVLGTSLKEALALHRDSARLFASAKPDTVDPKEHAKVISKSLVDSGLDEESAIKYEAVVIAFVLGWTVYDQNPSMHAYLEQMFDFENSFEFGLNTIVNGLAVSRETT